MEFKGKIIQVLPLQTGLTKTGSEWARQQVVMLTEERYPHYVAYLLAGSRVDTEAAAVGDRVRVQADVSSREYEGRWYTEVSAWRVEKTSD
jgi:hypothetical protein